MSSLTNMKFRKFGSIALVGLAVGVTGSTLAADSACKGFSKSECVSKDSCTWVEGYTTKKGVKVDAYCRVKSSKPKGGDSTTKKTTTEKNKSES